jgi:S-adenosylmethionine:tRNA ribosyltransferase-isomerase
MNELHISDYDYELPPEKIAQYPLEERQNSKLLEWKDGEISNHSFKDLPSLLKGVTQLVYNDTKVINARMIFERATGARVELFILQPIEPKSMELALASKNTVIWECMVGGGKRWKTEEQIEAKIPELSLKATKLKRVDGAIHQVKFEWSHKDFSFSDLLEHLGKIPLPPYMRRDVEPSDPLRYQTTYAVWEGSVAAPTAGLHFTPEVLKEIRQRKIEINAVTLHVGAGTFKPVEAEEISHHEMHAETVTINKHFVRSLIVNRGCRVAVGTTSLRSLESIFWLANRLKTGSVQLFVGQWDPYEQQEQFGSYTEALIWLLEHWPTSEESIVFDTAIIITPGYQIKSIDALITNFHMPKSTLLLLISAILGEDWKRVYSHAQANNYRFLSYGDSSLLWLNKKGQ